jgi:hypothetical protein
MLPEALPRCYLDDGGKRWASSALLTNRCRVDGLLKGIVEAQLMRKANISMAVVRLQICENLGSMCVCVAEQLPSPPLCLIAFRTARRMKSCTGHATRAAFYFTIFVR